MPPARHRASVVSLIPNTYCQVMSSNNGMRNFRVPLTCVSPTAEDVAQGKQVQVIGAGKGFGNHLERTDSSNLTVFRAAAH